MAQQMKKDWEKGREVRVWRWEMRLKARQASDAEGP